MIKQIHFLQTVCLCLTFVLSSAINAFSLESESSVVLESRYLAESDIEAQSGQISISETKASFKHEFKLENGMPISFSLQNKHIDINSDAAVYLPSNLVARSLGFGVKFPAPFTQSENYFIGLDVFPSFYTDGWSETSSSSFRIPSRAFLIYKRDEDFIVIAGVSIRPDFDAKLLPLFGFIYRPNEKWEFNFLSDNPQIIYSLSDKTKVFWEADIVNEEYEVEHNGEKGRVLFYRELSSGAGIRHEFTKNISGLVSAGSVFSRMLRYEDDNGKVQPDTGVYVKARMSISF